MSISGIINSVLIRKEGLVEVSLLGVAATQEIPGLSSSRVSTHSQSEELCRLAVRVRRTAGHFWDSVVQPAYRAGR